MIHPLARDVLHSLSLPDPLRKPSGSVTFDFSSNINPYGNCFRHYPSKDHQLLKEEYIRVLGRTGHHKDVETYLSPNNILFTVGSVDGFDLILKTFAEPGIDTICIPTPAFSAFLHWSKIYNLSIFTPSLKGDSFNYLDTQDIMNQDAKILVLCSPNNPVGSCLSVENIESISKSFKGLIVVDEAYLEFSTKPSAISLLKTNENIVILKTLSKAWSMAGHRCGIVLGSSIFIDTLKLTQTPFPLSTSSQKVILRTFQSPDKIIKNWSTVRNNRKFLEDELSQLEIVGKIYSSEANFILVEFSSFEEVLNYLKKENVMIFDNSFNIKKTARITVSSKKNNISLIQLLKKFQTNVSKSLK